jgi:hypothetical protein
MQTSFSLEIIPTEDLHHENICKQIIKAVVAQLKTMILLDDIQVPQQLWVLDYKQNQLYLPV